MYLFSRYLYLPICFKSLKRFFSRTRIVKNDMIGAKKRINSWMRSPKARKIWDITACRKLKTRYRENTSKMWAKCCPKSRFRRRFCRMVSMWTWKKMWKTVTGRVPTRCWCISMNCLLITACRLCIMPGIRLWRTIRAMGESLSTKRGGRTSSPRHLKC